MMTRTTVRETSLQDVSQEEPRPTAQRFSSTTIGAWRGAINSICLASLDVT
jgi:hypothetical protein